jgi:GAF domain-containing protein
MKHPHVSPNPGRNKRPRFMRDVTVIAPMLPPVTQRKKRPPTRQNQTKTKAILHHANATQVTTNVSGAMAPKQSSIAEPTPANVSQDLDRPANTITAKMLSDKAMPAKVASAKAMPAKVASAKAMPAKVTPAKVTPAKVTPAKVTPAKATQVKTKPSPAPTVDSANKRINNKQHNSLQTNSGKEQEISKKPTNSKHLIAKDLAARQIADLQRELQYLTLSHDLTRELVDNTSGMKKVMQLVFDRVLNVINAEAGSLWLFDEKSGTNVCQLAEGPSADDIVGVRLPLKKGIVGGVIANNQADVVLNCALDLRFDSEFDKKSHFKTESLICVPLTDAGEAYGAIEIINKRSGFQKRFSDDDRRLVEDISIAASIAGRNARLLESESRVEELNTLMEISQQISGSIDLDQVLDLVVNLSGDLAETSFASISLVEESKDVLFLAAFAPEGVPDQKSPWQKKLLELMDQVRKSGKLGYVADATELKSKDPESQWVQYLEDRGMVSAWAVPLKDEEGVLGVLWMESEESKFMSGSQADMATIMATQATVSIRNASLYHRIPFADVLAKVSQKGKKLISGWLRLSLITMLLLAVGYGLHVLPVFRSVSGECLVESRFGQGIYLRTAGRIKESLVKEGQIVKAGDVLAILDDLPIRLKLIESESSLALLERQIVEAKAASDASAISRALIERISSQATLRQARRDIAHIKIRSPIDGIILTPRPSELIGRDFPVGAEILRVANPENFTVVAEIPEEDVLDVHIGQSVSGILRSRPGMGFRGEVLHVGRAYSVPAEALEEGVTDTAAPEGFVAEIKVLERDVDLLPGMTGLASISTPDVSVMTRFGRRIINFAAFWFGITFNDAESVLDTAPIHKNAEPALETVAVHNDAEPVQETAAIHDDAAPVPETAPARDDAEPIVEATAVHNDAPEPVPEAAIATISDPEQKQNLLPGISRHITPFLGK